MIFEFTNYEVRITNLFSTIMDILISNGQLVRCLGTAAISASEDSNRMLSYAPSAELLVRKALGSEAIAYLKISAVSEIAGMTGAKKLLFGWVERAVAFYTYNFYLPFSIGSDGDNGLQETESEKTKPVRMGALNERKNATPEMAAEALEEALRLLFENPDDYDFWQDTDAFKSVSALFIRFGSELGKALPPSGGTYRMFLTLRDYIVGAERDLVKPILGKVFFDSLKTKLTAGNLTTLEKELIEYVSRYEAWAAYLEALDYLVVWATPKGLRVLSEFDGINNRKTPNAGELADLKLSVDRKM